MTKAAVSNFSFTRQLRLTTKAGFTAVFNERLKISQGWFLAIYKSNQQPHPRLGVIISKRIVKKATSRNYLKRIIREGFRLNQKHLAGLDIVVMAQAGLRLEDKAKLQKDLGSLWLRLIACCQNACSS